MNVNSPPVAAQSDDGFGRSNMSDRLTRGNIAKWDAERKWHDRDGLKLPSPMFVLGVNTALQRWKNQRPETILAKPLPDPEVLNAAIPVAEWELDLTGRPRPPWERVVAIYLVDLGTGTPYTYASATTGARICLQESVVIMRTLRGAHVLPLVNLEQRPMKTSFGMKSRPHLQIIEWRTPGDGGGNLPPPSRPQLTGPATTQAPPSATPASTASTSAPETSGPSAATLAATAPVKPVTMAEFVADELPPWA
jgi:hypothetical protein